MSARIGIVGYLNAHPLTDFLDRDRFEVVSNHPSVVAGMLRRGEVDVALCPVAAVLHDDRYQVVPGFCIGSEGPVTSVLLVAETPPEAWEAVVLDGVSRTSVVLARLLLTQGPLAARVRPDLRLIDGAPGSGVEAARGATAAVVIGDVARQLPPRLSERIDLASAWKAWTGLPFVFAVWAGRPGLDPAVIDAIRDAGARGVAAISARPDDDDRRYLEQALRYGLDDRALMGLRRFAALGHKAGLLRREDVDLYGPASTWRPRADVDALLARAADGARLSRDELLTLWTEAPLADLALVADQRRRELHGDAVPYTLRAAGADVDGLVAAGCTLIALHGAPSPERTRLLRQRHPGVRLQGGVPGLDAAEAFAGVDWLHDDAGQADRAAVDAGWAAAAAAGARAVATWVIGRGESLADRVDTVVALRDAQDRHGVFDAARVWAAFGDGPAGSEANTAVDHLRAVAMTRIALDNVRSLMAAPDTEGFGMAQASLRMGCDSFGWVSVDDPARVDAVAADVEHHITTAGFTPARDAGSPRPISGATERGAAC